MKRQYLIWSFLQIILILQVNSLKGFEYNEPSIIGDKDTIIMPQFGDFYMGLSYKEVVEKLRIHKATLEDYNTGVFKFNLPIYDLLSNIAPSTMIDIKKERIYYDDETFFDLKSILLTNKLYKFYYLDPYYLVSINDIKVVAVDYPSRINARLDSLKFKFFKNRLYALEYKVSNLKPYEIERIRDNYLNRYGVLLLQKDNLFKTKEGIFVVRYNHITNPDQMKIILMGSKQFNEMKAVMDSVIRQLLLDLSFELNKKLYNVGSGKEIILIDRKNSLYKKLIEKYGLIDQF